MNEHYFGLKERVTPPAVGEWAVLENARLRLALELIRDSGSFKHGTSVKELQGIARAALAKVPA